MQVLSCVSDVAVLNELVRLFNRSLLQCQIDSDTDLGATTTALELAPIEINDLEQIASSSSINREVITQSAADLTLVRLPVTVAMDGYEAHRMLGGVGLQLRSLQDGTGDQIQIADSASATFARCF